MKLKRYYLYMLFAVISIGVNLGSQYVTEIVLSQFALFHHALLSPGTLTVPLINYPLSLDKEISWLFMTHLVVGTGFGFIVKFVLDKFIVFQESHQNFSHTFKQVFIYGLLAIITTLIFWGFQFAFKIIFTAENAWVAGGLIGLIIGYTTKYFLDKLFVFKQKEHKNT